MLPWLYMGTQVGRPDFRFYGIIASDIGCQVGHPDFRTCGVITNRPVVGRSCRHLLARLLRLPSPICFAIYHYSTRRACALLRASLESCDRRSSLQELLLTALAFCCVPSLDLHKAVLLT